MSLLKSMPILSGVQDQTWCSRGLSTVLNTEKRITSPHLLAVYFPMQCRQKLVVFTTGTHWFKLLVHPDPRSFFQSCFSASHCSAWPEVASPLMQDLAFSLLSFARFPSAHFSTCPGPTAWQHTQLVSHPPFPVLFLCCALGAKQETSPSEIAR